MTQDLGDKRLVNPWALFGANNLTRRTVWAELGGYNESLRTNGEDSDFAVRAREAGYTIVHTPQATTYHLKADTLGSLQRTHWRYRYFGFKRWTRPRWYAPREIFDHIKGCIWVTRRDLKDRNLEIIPITAWLICYVAYRELRYAFSGKV